VAKGKRAMLRHHRGAPAAEQTLLPLVYPVTTEEVLPAPLSYEQVISDFYDEASVQVAAHLDAGARRGGDLRRRPVLLRLLHVPA
jgi:precorrin-2/cobalt-factor-2 C20-methyltransferase